MLNQHSSPVSLLHANIDDKDIRCISTSKRTTTENDNDCYLWVAKCHEIYNIILKMNLQKVIYIGMRI
jgi:hypothetical protein